MRTPYGFIGIDVDHAAHDSPMPRDGSSTEERLSGELLITLEALTPLIVGNHHQNIDDRRSAIAPERLDDGHRRVLIAGSGLKGMLRHALAGLTNSPMERVLNRHYTYRPNLGFGDRNDPRMEMRAAIVEKIDGAGAEAAVTLKLLPSNSGVVFVRGDAMAALGHLAAGSRVTGARRNVELSGSAPRMRLDRKSQSETGLDHFLFRYCGGIDGEGMFAQAFNGGRTYKEVLVSARDYERAQAMPVPAAVLENYLLTQKVLASEHHGHLSPGHPLMGKNGFNKKYAIDAIEKNAGLQCNQLVYVEVEYGLTPSGKKGMRIGSMGHHFQYRWAYTSSTLKKAGKMRRELDWLPVEEKTEAGMPCQLAASRLLFGYALDGKDRRVAAGNWKRLAGRISLNHALEVIESGRESDAQRFVKAGNPITLKILGMPRPSAVEFYLKQEALPNRLTTYGDLPGDPGGDLAGRKFYRHQPDAASRRDTYSPTPQTLMQDANAQERGTLVHNVSAPGTKFRFTLRFDQLREWELGALLAALEPARLAQHIRLPALRYAHKLGYGKPLGLGSVSLSVDKVRYRRNDSLQWQEVDDVGDFCRTRLSALSERLGKNFRGDVEPWLAAFRYPATGGAAYPTWQEKHGPTIYAFHTGLRRAHANARRGGKPDAAIFRKLQQLLQDDHG